MKSSQVSNYNIVRHPFHARIRLMIDLQPLLISLPLCISDDPAEVAWRLVRKHSLPEYLRSSVQILIRRVIDDETRRCVSTVLEESTAAIAPTTPSNQKSGPAAWIAKYCAEHQRYSEAVIPTEQEEFGELYHALIHSASCMTLLQLERKYAHAVNELISGRNLALANLRMKVNRELEEAARSGANLQEIKLKYKEDVQLMRAQWESELSAMKVSQRRDYRQFLVSLKNESTVMEPDQKSMSSSISLDTRPAMQRSASATGSWKPKWLRSGVMGTIAGLGPRTNSDVSSGSDLQLGASTIGQSLDIDSQRETPRSSTMLEESFTIHLGTQMKTMQNIRLVTASVLDLCRSGSQSSTDISALRAQTAMSLYSRSLNALVLCVERGLNYTTNDVRREFSNVCEQSTEFHFPDLEQQMQQVAAQFRETYGLTPDEKVVQEAGDFYTTKHSNLAAFHVVYHLAVEAEVKSDNLSPRSQTINGLRNVLFNAFKHDCLNVTLPLLLVHTLPEDATEMWCLRRAELVLKCIKGFLMESSAANIRAVHFVLPESVNETLFTNISSLVTSVFRQTSAVDLKL